MASIATGSFSDSFNSYLVLGNEQYFRTFSFGSNWNILSIGVLLSIDSVGSLANLDAGFAIGVCSGNSGYKGGGLNPNHWIGGVWGTTNGPVGFGTPQAKFYNAANPIYTSLLSYARFITGSATSDDGGHGAENPGVSLCLPSNTGTARRFAVFVNIAMSSTSSCVYYSHMIGNSDLVTPFVSSSYNVDQTVALVRNGLYDAFVANGGEYFGGASYQGPSGMAVVNPSSFFITYPLDTLNIYWNNSSNQLHVHYIGVMKDGILFS